MTDIIARKIQKIADYYAEEALVLMGIKPFLINFAKEYSKSHTAGYKTLDLFNIIPKEWYDNPRA